MCCAAQSMDDNNVLKDSHIRTTQLKQIRQLAWFTRAHKAPVHLMWTLADFARQTSCAPAVQRGSSTAQTRWPCTRPVWHSPRGSPRCTARRLAAGLPTPQGLTYITLRSRAWRICCFVVGAGSTAQMCCYIKSMNTMNSWHKRAQAAAMQSRADQNGAALVSISAVKSKQTGWAQC